MKREIALAVAILFVAGLGTYAFSQDGEKELAPAPDAAKLIDQLGADDFTARSAAEGELLKLGEKAVPALEKAMKEHADTHVRFEAERILRKIRGRAERSEKPLAERRIVRDLKDGFKDLEELLKDLEERGIDIRDWFEDDFGPDFDAKIRELQERLEKQLGLDGRTEVHRGHVKGVVESDGERLEYERGEDGGVTVRVTRDGKTTTYEAESPEALKDAHPEVYEKVKPFLGGVEWFGRGRPGFGFRLRGLPPVVSPFGDLPSRERPWQPPGGFRLGIWVGEVGEPLRLHLKLGRDEGILVEDVVPGSLADRMGLAKYDVIRTLNGVKVAGAEDVRKVLATVPSGGKVEVDLIRRGEPMKLYANR